MKSKIRKTVAKNLRLQREAKGLTLQTAADRLSRHRGTLVKWEKGERLPSVAELERVAKLYRCTLRDLIE